MNIKNFDFNKRHTSFQLQVYTIFDLSQQIPFQKKDEQNFKSVFTFVQLRVRMKLLKDMRSEDNEYCKIN
ncbi:hypothetical protein COE58_01245 [Bacillus cereus]|nr:hypothetical protein COE58_01245 [Bacillus cereus]